MLQVLQYSDHEEGTHKLWKNVVEPSQHDLIYQVPFAMPVTIEKVNSEYHKPVSIHKVMDSSTVASTNKFGCMTFSFDTIVKILNG